MFMSSPTLESLKSRYRTAAKAFVLTDYTSAALALEPVSVSGASSAGLASPEWLAAVEQESPTPLLDFERRLAVLRITFLATVHSTPTAVPSSCASLASLAALPASALINALWANITSAPPSSPSSTTSDIFATPLAAFLHPSLVVALALAALKLDEPRQARSTIEAWFGSVSEQVDRVVFIEVSQDSFDWRDFAIEGEGGQGASGASSMAASGVSGDVDPKRSLVRSWVRLYDLLTLHVLPRLGEWEAAADFAKAQSVENGGWVPDERVEASLRQIVQLQQDEAVAIASKLQRQRDLDSLKLDKRNPPRDNTKDRRRDTKGKSRARTTDENDADLPLTNGHRSDGSSPSSSPRGGKSSRPTASSSSSSNSESADQHPHNTLPHPLPPATGFAALRSHLSSYLARTSSEPESVVAAPPPIRSVAAYIRYHYATDPVRLLTVVCFVFAFTSWVRRTVNNRRAKGEVGMGFGSVAAGLRLVAGRLAETVRMGTKVTSL